jgi:hypothetical protein
MSIIDIPIEARLGRPQCGECHLQPGERCDICGAKEPECAHNWTYNHDSRMLECDHCELSRFGKPPPFMSPGIFTPRRLSGD